MRAVYVRQNLNKVLFDLKNRIDGRVRALHFAERINRYVRNAFKIVNLSGIFFYKGNPVCE